MPADATELRLRIMDFVIAYAKERGVDLPPGEEIDGHSTLYDLGFDSLDQAGMLTDIERDLDIDLENEVLERKLTLDDLLAIVTAAMQGKNDPRTA
jgi:acyl carrier protein